MSHLEAKSLSAGFKRYCEAPRIKNNPPSFDEYRARFGNQFPATETQATSTDIAALIQAEVRAALGGFLNGATETDALVVERVPAGTLPPAAEPKYVPRNPSNPATGGRLWKLNANGLMAEACKLAKDGIVTDGIAHIVLSANTLTV